MRSSTNISTKFLACSIRNPSSMKTRLLLGSARTASLHYLALLLASVSAPGLGLIATPASAASATWKVAPLSNDWSIAVNWTPETVPDEIADVATFGVSNVTDVMVPDFLEIGDVVFEPGASQYTIDADFALNHIGVINNSGVTQYFDISRTFGFNGTATAGSDIVYTNNGNLGGLFTVFLDQSNAGNATFINNGALPGNQGGSLTFADRSNAADSLIINNSPRGGENGGITAFSDTGSAANSTIITNAGGFVEFEQSSTAANATLIIAGGTVYFEGKSDGGFVEVQFSNGGVLVAEGHAGQTFVLGSLAGEGTVEVRLQQLAIGSNGLSTIFSGVIEEGSGGKAAVISKVGTGTLTLSGANTYTGGTTVEEGALLVATRKGSATGTGPVQVNGGTFGGRSNITGAVTIGSGSGPGADLAPGIEGPGVLVIKNSLSFKSDGTYNCDLSLAKSKADQVAAKGVTIESGAHFNLNSRGNQSLSAGTVFKVIDNRSRHSISGTFVDLPDNSTLSIGSNTLQVSYEGGDGNDLTLTVLP